MTPPSPATDPASLGRIVAAGKSLRMGGRHWFLNAVSYGPFDPARGEERLASDFATIRSLGFNAVRIYGLPSQAMLGEARANALKLLVGIPWTDHVDFLHQPSGHDDSEAVVEIKRCVRAAAQRLGQDDAVAALLVGNEIEKTLVRWMGPQKVKSFLESLIDIVHQEAPHCLTSYATYPSTEYLVPVNADFVAVNVYLEDRAVFEKYILRLQNLAGHKPLLITEFGLDVQRNGVPKQAEIMRWQREVCLRHGVAGTAWFSFTDEWHRGGEDVTGWSFGLVDRDRQLRLAAELAPTLPVAVQAVSGPRISVVVCTRNGSATLRPCLEALGHQRYANHEIIVIDDGSTDTVPQIAQSFPFVRYQRQDHAGLSVARNLGARLADGDVIAYTDDDCVPDEDWLVHLALAFDDPQWVAAGGPNIPPPPRNAVEAVVAHAPGGPSHVLLQDEEAEHLPGCNLAIRKDALLAIGGFQAPFRVAGDDVDVCWRLREAGGKLRFCPAAFVWHHRRFTVRAYFRQQAGYGRAEALLMKVHPQRFGPLGGARWRGLIYGEPGASLPPSEGSIFHGPYGTGAFQVIYSSGTEFHWWDWLGGILWVAMALLSVVVGLPVLGLLLAVIAAVMAGQRMNHALLSSRRDKALLWFLCLGQPVVREWSRLVAMIKLHARPSFRPTLPDILPPSRPRKWSCRIATVAFWSEDAAGREALLAELRNVLTEKGIPFRDDDGWRWFDLEIHPTRWISRSIVTVTEFHGGRRMLTRVGVEHRVRLQLLYGIVAALLLVKLAWLDSVQNILIATTLLALLWVLMGWVLNLRATRQLIEEAARRAGLHPHGSIE